MAFEPVYDVVRLSSRKRIASAQTVAEARLLPAPGTVIARVLSITAETKVGASEVFAGEARYGGRVDFTVLFVDVDGKNHTVAHSAEFSDKIESPRIGAGMQSSFSGEVLDTDVVNVSSSEIKLAAVVEIRLDADESEEIKCLVGGGTGIYGNSEEIEYSVFRASGTGTANLSSTIADVKATDILMSEYRAIVTTRTAGVDSVTINGLIIGDILGETEDGLAVSYRTEIPFSEEFPADGARQGDLVIARACVVGAPRIEADEDGSAIISDYELTISYAVYGDGKTEVVSDVFSATNELMVTSESATVCKPRLNATVTDRVEGSVTLEVNMPIADNILGMTAAKVTVSNAVAEADDEMLVEGVVGGNVIYYCAEANSENSVAVELPFSLKVAVPGLRENDEVYVCAEVVAVTLKIRRGNEIDVRADVAFEIYAAGSSTKCVITDLSEGEARIIPSSAISVHVARPGETLWDVAKATGSTPELVMLQNPDLELPLKGGERVLVYRYLSK